VRRRRSFKHHVTSYGIPYPLTVYQSGNNAGNLSYNKFDDIYCGYQDSIGGYGDHSRASTAVQIWDHDGGAGNVHEMHDMFARRITDNQPEV
jgi:hypothetical protein